MKKMYLLLVILFQLNISYSQITFQKKFGVTYYSNSASDIQRTSDNGYIIGGSTSGHQINGVSDLCMLKVDELGNQQWCTYYGAGMIDGIQFIRQTNDSGFIAAGRTSPTTSSPFSLYYLKTNSQGAMQWNKSFKLSQSGTSINLNDLRILSNGDYLILGNAHLSSVNNWDIFLMRINPAGDTLWTKTYTRNDGQSAVSVNETPDGGFLVTGYTYISSPHSARQFLLKLNSMGIIEWTKTYSINGIEGASSFVPTFDGGYIFCGIGESSINTDTNKIYLLKTDSSGNVSWCKQYSFTNDVVSKKIIQTDDHGYAIIGSINLWNPPAENYMLMLKTDETGNFSWAKAYGDSGADNVNSFLQTDDGGFILAGSYDHHINNSYPQIYLIKTDPVGFSGCLEFDIYTHAQDTIIQTDTISLSDTLVSYTFSPLVYQQGYNLTSTIVCSTVDIPRIDTDEPGMFPNPASEDVFFYGIDEAATVTVYDSFGRQVLKQKDSISGFNSSILDEGIYLVEVLRYDKRFVKKLIINRN
jgi:hypothetical protein